MSDSFHGGDAVAAILEAVGVKTAFGVISIHNMPILDALGRRGRIRFVPTRGEAGAVNMADGYARVIDGIGVAVTSTGTGAGNSAGALLEAMTAGTPVLHLTGQIERKYLDQGVGYIHEAPDQLGMLHAVSKAAYRVWSSDTLVGVLNAAIRDALTPPKGPVSVEIPIDVQKGVCESVVDLAPLPLGISRPANTSLERLADFMAAARRPLLWLGGGARHAVRPVQRLAELGVGVITSVNGRGTLPEDHPLSLGAFYMGSGVESFFASCDCLVVAGSRLRSNETRTYTLQLPRPRAQIDIDPRAWGRTYPMDLFVCGDCEEVLSELADRVEGRMSIDNKFADDLAVARAETINELRKQIGPYAEIADALRQAMPRDAIWVRDVTIANSTWGNRYFPLYGPRDSAHAVGGGIGQGLQMGIGASLAKPLRKVVVLSGDGGLFLNVGELATAVQEETNIVVVVMNDRGYGVIRNIQDANYGERHYYVDINIPDLQEFARVMGLSAWRVKKTTEFFDAAESALNTTGPSLIEVDMDSVGPYPVSFAGPPQPASIG